MYRAQHTAPDARRGLILLVVLFMLTLFAITGISLVLYADAEALAARAHRDGANFPQPDMEPELAFSYFIGQVLYDTLDDETGIYSALRGHSLTRNMYGLNADFDPSINRWVLRNNYVPYHGPGRLHTGGASGFSLNPYGLDDYYLPNYTYFPGDGFLRDPERYARRTRPSDARGPYVGHNVGYTYADVNNMFLAATDADGRVLIPSYHRPWLFGPLDPSNANWTNAHGKYMILRPRPEDHARDASGRPLFPYPEDAFGDVKNWPWAPGGNDSIWIDIDAPVLTAPDGRKYKMLVAPLIVDLDSRLNVNVHGNVLGTNFDHRSHQGWGPWEVNLGYVLNARDPNTGRPDEWKNLLLGRPFNRAASTPAQWPGRFGADLPQPYPLPLNGAQQATALLSTPHRHAPIDFDGRDETNGGITTAMQMPGPGANPISVFPTFPNTGFGNASVQERSNHPLLYNVFRKANFNATSDDRVFPPSNMSGLLGLFDTGNEAVNNNDLIRLCPANLSDQSSAAASAASARRRRLLTTTSFDLDRPGVIPHVWDPADPNTAYRYDPNLGYATGAPIPFPDPSTRNNTPANSEFSSGTWQSVRAVLGRLNLDRLLRGYPAPAPGTGLIPPAAALPGGAYYNALTDRQRLTKEIFDLLRDLTGAYDPYQYNRGNPPLPAPTPEELNAVRFLAQLAVNIVDYIDSDDYMTSFNWGRTDYPQGDPLRDPRRAGNPAWDQTYGQEWVYGTELPRLLLNEAYVQLDNLAGESGTATNYNLNCWVEMHNPMSTSAQLTNNGDAVLQIANTLAYQIVLVDGRDPTLRNADNVRGEPDPTKVMKRLSGWGGNNATWAVQPCNGQFACMSQGPGGAKTDAFYVIGPQVRYQSGADPKLGRVTTVASPDLTYTIAANDQRVVDQTMRPTILLRRLVCPHLPFNATTNPYVTIDSMEDVEFNDGRTFNTTGPQVPPVMTVRESMGKNQPLASHATQRRPQAPVPPDPDEPKHTFLRHNATDGAAPITPGAAQTLKEPIDWLVHLDRQLISPIELLHVSGFKPHELTQKFVSPTVQDPAMILPFQHYAPWFVPEARISRLFGLIENKDRLFETVQGGRIPGRINLNTLWDPEVLLALCDPQPSNHFTAADIYNPADPRDLNTVYGRLLRLRSPGYDPANPAAPGGPGANDRPLLDPSTGNTAAGQQYPNGVSVADTLLNAAFLLPPDVNRPDHPYFRYELLNKIYSNITVRSNVFAVWVTVGFFEVVDDSTKPVKLGAEIGKAEGRHIRHRMFSVVDRTNASVFVRTVISGGPPIPPANPLVIRTANLALRTDSGLIYQLEIGLPLVWEPDTRNEETTLITNIIRNAEPGAADGRIHRYWTTTTLSHPNGVQYVARGNIGPWAGYDPPRDRRRGLNVGTIIPYWTLID